VIKPEMAGRGSIQTTFRAPVDGSEFEATRLPESLTIFAVAGGAT